jgi:histone deacetylase complex regulatory component SIN3
MRELRVEDALLYLDQVKVEFGDRPHIYNEFLDIMKTFKTHQIDTPGVIRRVSNLFHGNKKLVLGFNTFLPEGYKIELPEDGNGPPVAVFRAPGETVTHVLSGPGDPPATQKSAPFPASVAGLPHGAASGQRVGVLGATQARGMRASSMGQQTANGGAVPQGAATGLGRAPGTALSGHLQQPPAYSSHAIPAAGLPARAAVAGRLAGMPERSSSPGPAAPPSMAAVAQPVATQKPAALPHQQEQGQQQPGMEFDHAINYVTTIKKRFANEPETYKKFLEILHTYQKEQRGIKEVLEEVSALFSEHPDLLKEFTFFLPDAVQAEAKVQLDAAAQEAEARKQARQQAAAAASQDDSLPETPSSSRPVANPVPFGATMGRSREREHEIFRSVVYGAISFRPVRPPRKNQPTLAQVAATQGRPPVLPRVKVPTNTAETEFFEQAKAHLNRKELAADRPSATRVRHTPHQEFLKCLHMFGSGILNKDELLLLLRGLFMQGHAPKSGINVGGGACNPKIANDAQKLMQDLEAVSDNVSLRHELRKFFPDRFLSFHRLWFAVVPMQRRWTISNASTKVVRSAPGNSTLETQNVSLHRTIFYPTIF